MIKTCVASIIACKTKEDERAEGKEEVRVMVVKSPSTSSSLSQG